MARTHIHKSPQPAPLWGRHDLRVTISSQLLHKRLTNLTAHKHSHIALHIHQHCNPRFGHFARTVPRGFGMGDGCGDTVVTFPERADIGTLDVAAVMLGLPAASLPRNTRSDVSLPMRVEGMVVGHLSALADAAHVGAGGLGVSSAIRFLTTQDACVRGDTYPRRCYDGADHVRTASECYDHNGVPPA
jgi:hypothetical protein